MLLNLQDNLPIFQLATQLSHCGYFGFSFPTILANFFDQAYCFLLPFW